MSDYEFKLIDKDTDISSLKIRKMPWDATVGKNFTPYQVVDIEGYAHTYGGGRGKNSYWMYPRSEEPTYENLIEFQCKDFGVCWGIEYKPYNYMRSKWDETEVFKSGGCDITRNGKLFYHCHGDVIEAIHYKRLCEDHPLFLNEYKYDEKMIGRKVWYRSEPGIIERFIKGQACVIIVPDGIKEFAIPKEYEKDMIDREDNYIKTEIFDDHVYWFRE